MWVTGWWKAVGRPRWPRPTAVRVRAAAAAALAAALCLGGGALWLRQVIHGDSVAGSIAVAQSRASAIASTYDTPAARANANGGTLADSPGNYEKWYEFPYFGMGVSFAVVDSHGTVLLSQGQLAYYIRESGLAFPASPPEAFSGRAARKSLGSETERFP